MVSCDNGYVQTHTNNDFIRIMMTFLAVDVYTDDDFIVMLILVKLLIIATVPE